MYQPFPPDRAKVLCELLKAQMDLHHAFDYADGCHVSTDSLLSGRGHMIGVLLCKDRKQEKHVLKAFSGAIDGRYEIPGWEPPCFSVEAYQSVLLAYDPIIKASEHHAALSLECQRKLFSLYRFHAIDGSTFGIGDVWGDVLPPSGSGDCCAPKLLSSCFQKGWQPVSLAEFYYGAPSPSHSRKSGDWAEPCEERCHPLIARMCGLDVLYCDDVIAVVDKPSGLLSVPGKGEGKSDCVVNRLKRLFPRSISQPSVHRLDQDTSGVLVYGLTAQAQSALSVQFAKGEVRKEYQALLEGLVKEDEGDISFPIRTDWERRPMVIYDPKDGKEAITHWEKIKVERLPDGRLATRVRFLPHTGRTHQLRVHSAFPQGLGHPIVGDPFYGTREEGQRLCLHARRLEFHHPSDGRVMVFETKVPF